MVQVLFSRVISTVAAKNLYFQQASAQGLSPHSCLHDTVTVLLKCMCYRPGSANGYSKHSHQQRIVVHEPAVLTPIFEQIMKLFNVFLLTRMRLYTLHLNIF
jgi:hypothetical protein